MLRGWTLADITISAEGVESTDQYGYPCFSYAFTVNEILSDPNHENSAPLGATGSITVYADEAGAIELLSGNRYLIFLDRYEGEIYMSSQMIAKIGNDNGITAVPGIDGQNYFTSFDGYTVSNIREVILRIEAWREAHEIN